MVMVRENSTREALPIRVHWSASRMEAAPRMMTEILPTSSLRLSEARGRSRPKKSLTTTVASALRSESSEDMAAAMSAARTRPLRPAGKWVLTK